MMTVYVQRGGRTAAADRVDPEWLAPGAEAMFWWILAVMAGASGLMLWWFRRRGWL